MPEIVRFPSGGASIRPSSGHEAMHSSIGPWEEANRVYIDQSGLCDRLRYASAVPLVLYDVGMGIAANALAAIECAERMSGSGPEHLRPLEIYSFENSLEGLNLALGSSEDFPWLTRHREKLEKLLTGGPWERRGTGQSVSVQWKLLKGDFRNQSLGTPQVPAPEIIFYDFYSPKTNPELWGLKCFEKLWVSTEARRSRGFSSTLVTYCTSTAARSAMLLAGFAVGRGVATEEKRETTIAGTALAAISAPLRSEWLGRLARSSSPFPADLKFSRSEALAKVRAAAQFGRSVQ